MPTPDKKCLVRRHYLQHRGKPESCDIPGCELGSGDLVWNGRPFKLILDHINGNRCDNRMGNLRLVCPNCESQLPTHAGRNRGRVVETRDGGSTLTAKGGSIVTRVVGEQSDMSNHVKSRL